MKRQWTSRLTYTRHRCGLVERNTTTSGQTLGSVWRTTAVFAD